MFRTKYGRRTRIVEHQEPIPLNDLILDSPRDNVLYTSPNKGAYRVIQDEQLHSAISYALEEHIHIFSVLLILKRLKRQRVFLKPDSISTITLYNRKNIRVFIKGMANAQC